ncbi:MAG: ABC transporter substrate-binding protein [Saccharofermentanales bacterium]
MKIKKSLLTLLALLITVSMVLSACGSKTDDKKEDKAEEKVEEKAEEKTEKKADESDAEEEPAEEEPAEETPAEEEPAEDDDVERSSDTLTVGTVDMDGFFINGFTNSSYDVAIKTLLGTYGKFYATFVSDPEGEWVLDETTNAEEPETTVNEDGSKTYRFFINDDLVWNDGEPITAKDYVFGVLFAATPEWKTAGATTAAGDKYVGYTEYHAGDSTSFPGIKYIDDTTFEVTMAAEFVPSFYETADVAIGPTPMHRYTPNLDIGEDGSSLVVKEGYEVTDQDKADYTVRLDEQAAIIESDFEAAKAAAEELEDQAEKDAELAAAQEAHDTAMAEVDALRATVDSGDFDAREVLLQSNAYEVAQVYRYAPDVTCGPYNFVENKNQTVILELNDLFVGDYEGNTPTIPTIIQKTIPQDSDADQLISGQIDLAIGVSDEANIQKLKEAEEEGKIGGYCQYPRAGFGMIRFLTDLGPTAHKEVRQAIAYLIDRDLFIQNYFGGYGSVTNGYYGLDEWMYRDIGEEFEEKANIYTLNIDKANELLDASPYTFEADGKTPWDADKAKEAYEADADKFDYFRYDADGEKLAVNQTGANKDVLNIIAENIPNNGKLVGLQYTANEVDFPVLLDALYNPNLEKPTYTAFSLGTGFYPIFQPYYSFHSSQIGNDNLDRVNDPEADRITTELNTVDPEERELFLDKWLEFQLWFNDYLPELPLYSNDYFDAYAPNVEGMETLPYWAWYEDICNISLK